MKPLTETEALQRCAAYCSTAERCLQDIQKKLDRWEIPDSAQKNILSKLQKEGFLDESRYCRFFVNDKTKFGKWGKNKIIHALKQKKLPEECIREAILQIEPDENRERLTSLLRQKMKTVKGKNNYEIRMKLMRFAAGRGFEPPEINQCLNRITGSPELEE